MLPDYGRYYGSVFTRIFEHHERAISIQKMDATTQGFYLLDERIPLYIKFSRNRKGPWSFNFQRDHQVKFRELVERYGDCIVALVCGTDGIVALNDTRMKQLFDHQIGEQESIVVRRKLNQMYGVSGSDGELSQKLSRDSLLELLELVTLRFGSELKTVRG